MFGEDSYAGGKFIQKGYKIAYVADSKVYHSHNYTIFEDFKRYFDIGVFHKTEFWLLKEFGKAEGEGIKYIKSGIGYILKSNQKYLLIEFFIRIFVKYLGYKLGQNYTLLPMCLSKQLTLQALKNQ